MPLVHIQRNGVLAEWKSLNRRIYDFTDKSQIELLRLQLADQHFRGRCRQLDRDMRIPALQMKQQMGHQIIGHRDSAADSQLIRNMSFRLYLMLAGLIDLENLLGIGEELLAFIGEINLLAQPVKYPAIQLPFERLYTGGNCRLRDIQDFGRFIEASIMVDVHKGLNIFNVHT